ncbi:hypothetical protein Cfla_3512 [Cellulomonas flavigena DSM 20109]|uniref:Uncharacterized protein n=1 Tax=Cellulomonas flavigena (strain ATCC 482 / DSM 20109 / BCRC 11376 / JCM 18109 / NBRC 3775 / NCIMB 8073 / NRS 134) TaxID=446466 RepID=D5UDC8_CELFN|nr:hypothetical protein Cfla_3512 [Cellulomonas flavigena DSM 20109]
MTAVWWSSPAVGDWVRTTRTEATSLTDVLQGGGLPAGTRGVVVSRDGRWARVRAEDTLGTVEVTVPAHHLRVTARGRGEEAFARSAGLRSAVRVGAFLALAAPVLWFVVQYMWINRGTDGLLVALVLAALDSAAVSLLELVDDPVRAVLAAGLFALTARVAFGPRKGER